MITSLKNLKAGIKWWRDKGWEQDFLNAEYYAIYDARSAGTTKEWWAGTVDRLGQWRAYRGRTSPNTKAEIHSRGDERLGLIGAEFTKLICSGAEPSIADVSWEDTASFFAVVSEIKPRSPVFAGKMCHFTLPRLFIVMDNAATSVFGDYEFYWRGMKDQWSRFPAKADARNLFEEAIKSASEKPLHPSYPFETKILELSHIGYNHG